MFFITYDHIRGKGAEGDEGSVNAAPDPTHTGKKRDRSHVHSPWNFRTIRSWNHTGISGWGRIVTLSFRQESDSAVRRTLTPRALCKGFANKILSGHRMTNAKFHVQVHADHKGGVV